LLDDRFEDLFRGDLLWARVDHLIRNDDYLRRFPFTNVGLAQGEEALAYFLEYCVRVLVDGARASPRGARFANALGIDGLNRLLAGGEQYVVRFHASWVIDDAEDAEVKDASVALVWLDDLGTTWGESRLRNVTLVALLPGFKVLADPPARVP
jgi:hypothetical protein